MHVYILTLNQTQGTANFFYNNVHYMNKMKPQHVLNGKQAD